MKSFFAILLAFFLSACTSCAPPIISGPWGYTTDGEALKNQRLMRQTVMVVVAFGELDGEKTETRVSQGSGVVIDVKRGSSLVMTADHVCAAGGEKTIGRSTSVMTSEGEILPAVQIYHDKRNDLCLLSVLGVAGLPAKVGKIPPPLGGRVMNVGAPRGVFTKWLIPVVSGYVSGYAKMEGRLLMCSSLPAVGGQSGSGVYYNGELVGILVMALGNYEHMAYVVMIDEVNSAIAEARKKWLQKSM